MPQSKPNEQLGETEPDATPAGEANPDIRALDGTSIEFDSEDPDPIIAKTQNIRRKSTICPTFMGRISKTFDILSENCAI